MASVHKIKDPKTRKLVRFRNIQLESKYNFGAHIYGVSTEEFIFECCYSKVSAFLNTLTRASYSKEVQQELTSLVKTKS